jgi:hypothetical protein
LLDHPFDVDISGRVRVIVLFSEPVQELEDDPDDTPIEEIRKITRKLPAKQSNPVPRNLPTPIKAPITFI